MEDQKYATFSESEASENLQKCMDYFFSDDDGRKKYKFSDAYLKFSKFADDEFISTKRIYNVIKSTNLVNDEVILRVNSLTGFVYLIDKKYLERIQRHMRLKSRQTTSDLETTDATSSKQTSPETVYSQKSPTSFVKVDTPQGKSSPSPQVPSGIQTS